MSTPTTPHASKIGLGTAQWGTRYGVSNTKGIASPDEIKKILRMGQEFGIRTLDTAHLYGNSETVLGTNPLDNFRVVSKTPKFENSSITKEDASALINTTRESLKKLGVTSIYGLLVHDANDILKKGADWLIKALNNVKELGLVQKVGFSCYSPEQAFEILSFFTPDLVQVPLNIFDQRMLRTGCLDTLKRHGVEIHTRSTFLQGLILMPPHELPGYFRRWTPPVENFHLACKQARISPLHAALSFALRQRHTDLCIIGVVDSSELADILNFENLDHELDFSHFHSEDIDFIEPRNWIL